MESTDILDGSKMLQQSALNDIILNDENEELRELSNAFLTISENEESKGDTAEAFRQQMLDYKNLIDSAISANKYDISDNTTAYYSFWDYYFDGDVILRNLTAAQTEKGDDERSRDYHYREWLDSYDSVLGIFTGAYHYYTYLYYCGCVSSDQREIEYWEEIIRIFDDTKATTSGLFANSVATRDAILLGLSDLKDNFVEGNYNVDLDAKWRLQLEEAFKKYYFSYDATGQKIFDEKTIFSTLINSDDLSDSEYQALLDTLTEMGYDVSQVKNKNDLKDAVYNEILKKYNSFNFDNPPLDPDGNPLTSPFELLSQEERDYFVYVYESKHPEDAKNMNVLCNQLGETLNAYDGWEVDARNIKFLVYTADEPYKSAYINSVGSGKITIRDTHNTEDGFVNHGNSFDINIDEYRDKDGNHTIDFYSCFIHESSHAVYSYTELEGQYAQKITNTMIKDLKKRIRNEVDDWLSSNPKFNSLSKADKKKLKDFYIDCIMNQLDADDYGVDFKYILKRYDLGIEISPEEAKDCYDYVVGEINSYVDGPIADQYGGLTGNTVGGGHDAVNDDRIYWVENNNKVITINGEEYDVKNKKKKHIADKIILNEGNVDYQEGKIANEMFAEGMDSHITKRASEVVNMRLYADKTLKCFDDMVETARDY